MTRTDLFRRKETMPSISCIFATLTLLLGGSAWAQSTEKVIFDLGTPQAGGELIFDNRGNLYGTANGDSVGRGTVFEATPSANGTWRHSVPYRFAGGTDGKDPNPGLVFDSAGNLYGTTVAGGANYCLFSNTTSTCGTVFELTPTSTGAWTEKQLYNFAGNTGLNDDGANPSSGLVADSAGNLYGTTSYGGSYHGTVFRLTPGSDGTWTETILYDFTDGEDGRGPSGLIRDRLGNLYGTAGGGTTGGGTIFELSPSPDGTWTFHLVYTFCSRTNCSDGNQPWGIALDTQRNLYGVTRYGGAACTGDGCGTIFKLGRGAGDSWVFHLLHSFCAKSSCPDGAVPQGAPTLAADGTVYGTTFLGGNNGQGTVFKLVHTTSGWVFTTLYSFCPAGGCPDGRYPDGAMALDSAGNLFGTTIVGGVKNGVVFELTP
jgi:uncharacterized repeat protein (TIGR03803 family)